MKTLSRSILGRLWLRRKATIRETVGDVSHSDGHVEVTGVASSPLCNPEKNNVTRTFTSVVNSLAFM